MERTEIKIGKMLIVVTAEEAMRVELNGYNYFIDDSTNEQLIDKFKEE
tara:strand:+ start:50 stop:193 length:144 start_codon:yes stop_codon:yes gene_type:complete